MMLLKWATLSYLRLVSQMCLERKPGNGEKSRALAENDAQHIQGVQETATDPRTDSKCMPEIRRQKSVRKMMEDGINSSGRVQF